MHRYGHCCAGFCARVRDLVAELAPRVSCNGRTVRCNVDDADALLRCRCSGAVMLHLG